MRSTNLTLYNYDELDDVAKKNVRKIWMDCFNEYYARRFVGGNVRGVIKENAEILSFKFDLAIDRSREMQVVSIDSVIMEGKFLYKGHEVELKREIQDGKESYQGYINDGQTDEAFKNDVQDWLGRIRNYAGLTFWQYYKWASSGRIFEVYGFEFLKDGTPVKLSYEKEKIAK